MTCTSFAGPTSAADEHERVSTVSPALVGGCDGVAEISADQLENFYKAHCALGQILLALSPLWMYLWGVLAR